MRLLEEFWYGNIEPTEYGTSSNKGYKKLVELIFRNEEKLAIRVYRSPSCFRRSEVFASQGRCRRFPVVVSTAFYRRKRICRGRGAGPMSQNALSVAGRSVSCCLSGMPGSAGPCGSRRGGLLLPRSGYR